MPRPPSSEAHDRLLRTAIEILANDGVDACSAEEVSRRSGVARTTLYRHFGTIEGLVFAAVALDVRDRDPVDTGNLRGDLWVIQKRYLATASARRSRQLFAWMMGRALADPAHRELFLRARSGPAGPTRIALQRAIARGELAPETDLDLALHLIQGPLISQRLVDDREVTDAELASMLDATLVGLGHRSPSAD